MTVSVKVLDDNDNGPEFMRPHFEMKVQENQPKHSVVGTVFSRDPDTEVDNHLRYEFTAEFNQSDTFYIDRMSGTIYTQRSLDRESRDMYSFGVRVFDETRADDFYDTAQVGGSCGRGMSGLTPCLGRLDQNGTNPEKVPDLSYFGIFCSNLVRILASLMLTYTLFEQVV